jgi:hypothetical protein
MQQLLQGGNSVQHPGNDNLADFVLVTLLFYFHVCAGLTSIGSEWCTAMS